MAAAAFAPLLLAPVSRLLSLDGLGTLRANVLADEMLEALNVPFATPPVGDLRFTPARDPLPWTGTRDATGFGPGCLQQKNQSYPTSEDCLQLNVWSPAVAPSNGSATQPALRPVYVWVFGGGLTQGSGVAFNGSSLARRGEAVVVTINYRLGAFGFFASDELWREGGATGGLNGVHDVLQALRFLRQHVAKFGGDPSHVTLAGESSGSVASCILAYTPLARGLFQRLALQSGICTGPWMGPDPSRNGSFAVSATFAADVDCPSKPCTLAELRAAPASSLLASSHWVDPNFGLDGQMLSALPSTLKFQMEGSEVLLGGNTEDTTCATTTAAPLPPLSGTTLRAQLATYFGADVDTVLAPYLKQLNGSRVAAPQWPPQPQQQHQSHLANASYVAEASRTITAAEARAVWINMSRDAGVTCPTLHLARELTSSGVTPYLYRFGFNSTRPGMGVLHGGEVDLVFQKLPPNAAPGAAGVSSAAGSYWTNFITRGAPLRPTPVVTAWPTWPHFGDADAATVEGATSRAPERFLEFDAAGAGRVRTGGYGDTCAAWEAYTASSARARANYIAFGYLC